MQPDLLITLSAVFIGVTVVTMSLARTFLLGRNPLRSRLQPAAGGAKANLALETPVLTDTLSPTAKKISTFIPKSPKDMSILRRRLTSAGYRSINTAVVFYATKVVLALAVAVLHSPLRGDAGSS